MPGRLCAFFLTVLVATFLATSSFAQTAAPTSAPSGPRQAGKNLKPLPPGVVQIHLLDLHCKTCARRLAGKLYAVPGVLKVRANLKKDVATVTLQKKKPAAPAKLWDAVIAAKLQPVELRVAAQRMTVKDFPKALKAAATPGDHAHEAPSPAGSRVVR